MARAGGWAAPPEVWARAGAWARARRGHRTAPGGGAGRGGGGGGGAEVGDGWAKADELEVAQRAGVGAEAEAEAEAGVEQQKCVTGDVLPAPESALGGWIGVILLSLSLSLVSRF